MRLLRVFHLLNKLNHSHEPVLLSVPGLMRSFKRNEMLGRDCHACKSQSSLGQLVIHTDGEEKRSECSLKITESLPIWVLIQAQGFLLESQCLTYN